MVIAGDAVITESDLSGWHPPPSGRGDRKRTGFRQVLERMGPEKRAGNYLPK